VLPDTCLGVSGSTEQARSGTGEQVRAGRAIPIRTSAWRKKPVARLRLVHRTAHLPFS
jgi:hypothetical protein